MITAKRDGTTITNGSASIGTREDLRESLRLRDEQTKGAAKGL